MKHRDTYINVPESKAVSPPTLLVTCFYLVDFARSINASHVFEYMRTFRSFDTSCSSCLFKLAFNHIFSNKLIIHEYIIQSDALNGTT